MKDPTDKGYRDFMLDLERRVRIVRSARIEAAKRYRREDRFYKIVTTVFTILVTILSVRFAFGVITIDANNPSEILIDKDDKLALIILSLSIYVTLFTLYVSSRGDGEKVSRFQSNYMELTRLHFDINRALARANEGIKKCECEHFSLENEYIKAGKRYASLLSQTENHDDIDFSRAYLWECMDEKESYKEHIAEERIESYEFNEIRNRVLIVFSIPIILAAFYLIEKIYQ